MGGWEGGREGGKERKKGEKGGRKEGVTNQSEFERVEETDRQLEGQMGRNS